ncbi:uncharacterized protein LOC121374222 isoform X2 [Gigantopelta aegis]|uniref:uncharacterized protein LOC121374222 isoform X2 n=1 Tax=Gigantopelta aegis TaxID=1735272 RepID=UPI001B88B122|nr:uncharacterized protein LOC121374222 isoform X2 [Gigantopelta aegis]
MARTKRQVLLNAAKKQRRHGLLREAAGIIDTPQQWETLNQGRQTSGYDKNELHNTSPVLRKAEGVKRDLEKSFGSEQKQNVWVNESPKDATRNERIETITSSSCYPEKKLSKRRQLDTSYSPSLGSIRQLKLTARKSTHCEKKAEAEQIIAALMNSPHKTPNYSPQDVCPWTFTNSKDVGDLSPILPISSSTPAKNTARKSMSGSVGPVFTTKQRARKSISDYSSSFFHQVLAESSDIDESESVYLKVFPSVHEAVLTLPKCEKLPVALVCINDVLRSPNSPSGSSVVEQPSSPRKSSPRRSTSAQDDSCSIQLLKPAVKIKTKHIQKNIFDQFESEIKRSPKCSKSRASVCGSKLGSSDEHSPISKTVCLSKKSAGKTDVPGTQTRSPSPRKDVIECSNSPKGDHCLLGETGKTQISSSSTIHCFSEGKDRKGDIRLAFEKMIRKHSSSPRCDNSSNVDEKSPRRRSPRRTGIERDGAAVSLQQGSESEFLQAENKNSKSPTSPPVPVKQIQSPSDKLSPDTSRHKDEANEQMCKNSDCKPDGCSMRTGRSKKKLSPFSNKNITTEDSLRTPKELKCPEQSSTENVDEDNKKYSGCKNKSDKDSEKLKSSANNSCDNVMKCGKLLDLISRVGSRLQDSGSADFLNELPDSQDDSSSISLNTSDLVEEESLDTSMEIQSSVTSDDQTVDSSMSDSRVISKNSSTSEQCVRKSPRRKVFPDECNKAKCDRLETDSSKTEDRMLQISDYSPKYVLDSKKLSKCDLSGLLQENCDKGTKDGLKPSKVKLENDTDVAFRCHSELSPKVKNSQLHAVSDSSFEGAFLAFTKIEKEKFSPKINLRNLEKTKTESCHKESVAANSESKSQKWAGSAKTVEPSPLDVLCKPEKSNADKRSAFVSDDLENFLCKVKSDSLNVDQTGLKTGLAGISDNTDIEDKNLAAFEPDFDEIEGVLFLSFANEDALKAHIAVEKKNHWDKDCNYFWGISRYKAFEKQRSENKSCEKNPVLRNLRGKHMKWKKYRRLLQRELNILKRNQLQTSMKNYAKVPSKTSDITKIKGWKKKYGGRNHFKSNMGLNVYASGKIHWRTEARLLRNMKADDIKALGIEIKKKRRKNVIFTNRKRTTKEFENRSDDLQEANDDDMVLCEVEDTVLSSGHSSRGSDCEYIYESDHALEDASEFKRLGVVKSTCIRKDFVNQFHWDEKDEQIQKKLGGRVRNRQKKNDPQDMRGMLAECGETAFPLLSDVADVPRKKKRQKFIPFVVLSKAMVKEAVKALFGEAVQPSRSTQPKELKTSFVKSDTTSGSDHETVAGNTSMETVEAVESSDSKSQDHSKDECDKPGCRYGCICHLCNSAEEPDETEVEPRSTGSLRACDKEYCRLGCICDSLDNHSTDHSKSHCSKSECQTVCVCKQRGNFMSPHLADEPTVIYDEADENNFEDLPPSLDKLESIDQKTSDETADKNKQSKKKKCDLDPEYVPDEESPEKPVPVTEEHKKKTRLPRGDRFVNLPRRESMHRTSKNLDAVTRKAMMLYEMSEIYWEAGERKRRSRNDSTNELPDAKSSSKPAETGPSKDSVSETEQMLSSTVHVQSDQHCLDSNTATSTNPKNKTKSSPNQVKQSRHKTREGSTKESLNVNSVTDTSKDDTTKVDELPSSTTNSTEDCPVPTVSTSVNIKTESSQPSKDSEISILSVEPILISGDDSEAEDETVSKLNSRRSSESVDDKADLLSQLWNETNVIEKIKKLTEDLKQKKNELKTKNIQQHPLLQTPINSNAPVKSSLRDPVFERRVYQWHTQMVCLKANPKPKSEEEHGDDSQEDEIKLLEFIANCNWDNAKSQILSRVAQCLNRGVYPNPKKMIVSDYCVEILPKADKPACIPPELREKLPDTMFSIRVKVTKKSDPVEFSQMKGLAGKSTSLVQQQLQKSKCMMAKISCDSASNRVFNKMNYRHKEFEVAVKHPSSMPTVSVKPSCTVVQSTEKQITKPEDVSKPKDGLSMAHKQSENNVGISGLRQLNISQSDLSNVSSTVSHGKLVKLGSQKCSSTKKKKKKLPFESDDLGQIVIENAETGAMKPLFGYNDDCTVQKDRRTKSSNKRKRKQDIACVKTFESAEDNKADDDECCILTECDDSQSSKNTPGCNDNANHIQSTSLKSDVGKNFVTYSIENGSLVENKSLSVCPGRSRPTTPVGEMTVPQTIKVTVNPAGSVCKTAKQTHGVHPGKQPLLLPAPLKGRQLLGPFSNLSDLKFITLPGGRDPSKTFLQLVSTTGGQPQQLNGPKQKQNNYHSGDYIAIPVTFKDDNLQALNSLTVSSCNGVKNKLFNSEEISSSCDAIEENADVKNSASVPQSETLPTQQTPKDSQKPSKKKNTKKKKFQEVMIESTNQIVYVKSCIPEDKKVKKKRPHVKVTQDVLDDYIDTIAQVAAVGKVTVADESVDAGVCPAAAAAAAAADQTNVDESKVTNQSALAALLLTDNIPSTSSSKPYAAAVAEGNGSVNPASTNSETLDTTGVCHDGGNLCTTDTSEMSREKTQSDDSSKDCSDVSKKHVHDEAVVSSSDTLAPCNVSKVQKQEPVLTQNVEPQNPETVVSTVCDVENVDPKVIQPVPCSEKLSSMNMSETQASDSSVKRKLPGTDVENCTLLAKRAKIRINSSSDKLYDLIVNKVAGFPFPEDSESENSMSVVGESLDDCCERMSMQINCEDSLDIAQAKSSVGLSATQSLLQHQLSGCNSPLQGKRLSPKTQTPRKMQATDLSECRPNKQLTERSLYSATLKPKRSLELAKMLLGDINQNFERQQKILQQNGCDDASERIPSSTGKNASCSLQDKICCTNKFDVLSKVPTETDTSTSKSIMEKSAEMDADSKNKEGCCVVSSNELS